MLRIHFIQQRFGLSDPAILRLRRLLEEHKLGMKAHIGVDIESGLDHTETG